MDSDSPPAPPAGGLVRKKRRGLPPWIVGVLVTLWILSIWNTIHALHSSPLASWSAWRLADQELRLAENAEARLPAALAPGSGRGRQEALLHWAAVFERDGDPRSMAGAAILRHLAGQPGKAGAVPRDAAEDPDRAELVRCLVNGELPDVGKLDRWAQTVAADGETYWWEEQLFLRLSGRQESPWTSDVEEASRNRARRHLGSMWLGAGVAIAMAVIGSACLVVFLWRARGRLRLHRVPPFFRWIGWRKCLAGVALGDLAALAVTTAAGFLLAGSREWTHLEVAVQDTLWRGSCTMLLVLLFFRRPRVAARALRLDRPFPLLPVAGALGLSIVIALICVWLLPEGPEHLRGVLVNPWTFGNAGLIFILWSGCVVAPLCEEIVYRGFLFNALSARFGTLAGILLSSAMFSAIHGYALDGSVSVFAFGVIASLLYRITGSLAAPVLVHSLFNFGSLTANWIGFEAVYW